MYRIEVALVLFAILPVVMAIVFRSAVMPRRRDNMVLALRSAASQPPAGLQSGNDYLHAGAARVSKEFDSQYSFRLLFPASILSTLYLIGFSLGMLLLAMKQGKSCGDWFCGTLTCISYEQLRNPIAALLGCYAFNTGNLVRRTFVADITKNIYWASINRIVISVGFAIAVAWSPLASDNKGLFACFIIAFVPRLFLTWTKKYARSLLSFSDSPVEELDIQLIQGIDIWKEERLEEEGIESVQNLATADAITLGVKTHYPLLTILDWIDQAILIQRFPKKFKPMQDAGMAVSAIEFCRISLLNNNATLIETVAGKLDINAAILFYEMQAMIEDAAIQNIWHLWQTRGGDE